MFLFFVIVYTAPKLVKPPCMLSEIAWVECQIHLVIFPCSFIKQWNLDQLWNFSMAFLDSIETCPWLQSIDSPKAKKVLTSSAIEVCLTRADLTLLLLFATSFSKHLGTRTSPEHFCSCCKCFLPPAVLPCPGVWNIFVACPQCTASTCCAICAIVVLLGVLGPVSGRTTQVFDFNFSSACQRCTTKFPTDSWKK